MANFSLSTNAKISNYAGSPKSCLGDPVYLNFDMRKKAASRFLTSSINCGFITRDNPLSLKLWRWIANGIVSSPEAFAIMRGTLSMDKLERYDLLVYYIDSGFCKESDFYFPETWHDFTKVKKVENIIPLK